MDLDEVADELYGLTPGEFVATRDARAATARGEGERALASAIAKLRRPSVSAWLTNLLARQCRAELDELLDLGPALMEAQEQLAGDRLRQLSQRRLETLNALTDRAESISRALGQPVNANTIQEVERTLQAALADPAAAAAVRRGRLTTALVYSGFGAFASPDAPSQETDRIPKGGQGEQGRRAEAAAAAGRQLVETRLGEVEVAARDRDRRTLRLGELESQVKQLRAEVVAASRSLQEAEQRLERARRDAAQAEQTARRTSEG